MAQVAFDAATTQSTGGGTSLTWAHPVGAGANRILFVLITWRESTFSSMGVPFQSVTAGGVAMTHIGERSHGLTTTGLWCLVAPASGVTAIATAASADYDGVMCITAAAVSLSEAEQLTPTPTSTVGTSSAPTIAAATTSGDGLVLDALGVFHSASFATRTPGAGQTERANVQAGSGSTRLSTSSSTEPGTGSLVTMSWTLSASKDWILIAWEVKPAPDEPQPPPPPAPAGERAGLSPYVRHELRWRTGIDFGP